MVSHITEAEKPFRPALKLDEKDQSRFGLDHEWQQGLRPSAIALSRGFPL
jgi:hypothetical protein